jgi:hypothetical protein
MTRQERRNNLIASLGLIAIGACHCVGFNAGTLFGCVDGGCPAGFTCTADFLCDRVGDAGAGELDDGGSDAGSGFDAQSGSDSGAGSDAGSERDAGLMDGGFARDGGGCSTRADCCPSDGGTCPLMCCCICPPCYCIKPTLCF